jgi:uroporphyrinogen-III synthase
MRGWRVLVTGPDGAPLALRLTERGAIPVAIPMIEVRPLDASGPLDRAAESVGDYDWVVVTSARGARALFERRRALGLGTVPAGPRWAAVGPATRAALEAEGVAVSAVPVAGTGAAIAAELGSLAGARVLLPRARIAAPDLPAALAERGARVDDVTAYDTVIGPESSRGPLAGALAEGIDAATFTSASAVAGFARLSGEPRAALSGALAVCIGPPTARALRRIGVEPSGVAARRTPEALIAVLDELAHARA